MSMPRAFSRPPIPRRPRPSLRRRHVDLVMACRYIAEVYLRAEPGKMLKEGKPLKDFAPHFILRLMSGQVPGWLKPVEIPQLDNYVIYEVREPGDRTPVAPRLPSTPELVAPPE